MMKKKTSLIFFGSGPVAAKSLELLAQDFDIEAIITKPTTEREMGAVCPDSPLFTIATKAELDVLISEQEFSSNLAVLIDFGIIVSQKVIASFELGIINSHFSLLPELRGADPISFAILEGKRKTGVSLMMLVEAMDEGPILAMSELYLNGSETTTSLTENLIDISYSMLSEIIPGYVAGSVIAKPQTESGSSYTRKLTKNDGVIDWTKSAVQIEREVRAYIDWPKSHATIGDIDCVITKAHAVPSDFGDIGEIEESLIEDRILAVQTGDGYLCIDKIKPANKKEMDIAGFINGYKDRLEL
jgi:methionyl-tRNA formyltransferase